MSIDPVRGEQLNVLPFQRFWPILAGALAGVALRIAFSGPPGNYLAAMTGGFIYFSPVLVAAVTVYIAERTRRRTWAYYFYAGFVANCWFVLGTLLIMIEGLICAIVIVPLLACIGGIAGLLMGAVCRLTSWPRSTVYSVAVLPFLVAILENGVSYDIQRGVVERSLLVNASPEVVWKHILNAANIQPSEIDDAWLFRIGVPVVRSAVTANTAEGVVRRVTMGKKVYFDEIITELQPSRHIHWIYRYFEDSFPKYALDDHVKLGGQYFDVTDAAFTLTRRGVRTELTMQLHYRVSTRFNWYADPVAKRLLANLASINLDFYKRRSERQPVASSPTTM